MLVVGLACSACGSFLLNGVPSGSSAHAVTVVTVVPPVQVVQRLPLSRSGTGSQSLGTFTVHGIVHIRGTCTGTGKIRVDFTVPHQGGELLGGHCKGNNTLALNWTSNVGTAGGPVQQIKVHAPAHTKWWVDIVDRQPKL